MVLIEWDDRYAIGIPAVDHEHRRLIELVNDLHKALMVDGESRRCGLFFEEVYTAISAHFALEERFMRETAYFGYAEHKRDHERLLDDLRDLMEDYESGETDFRGDRLSERLREWFGQHFQTLDAKLHGLLGPGLG